MASFCHDEYDHPLLWCDQKRRNVQKSIAQESVVIAKERRVAERLKHIKDQREYRDMIFKHCPWGRPGGGAPAVNIRRGNILAQGLYPESNADCRTYTPMPQYYGRNKTGGGGGAPLRNASGKIVTTIRIDPMISFGESTRNHVDNELRYKTSPSTKLEYKKQLDDMIAHKASLRYNSSDKITNDPWGKPGPGGMPWRDAKNIGQTFHKSMGWTDSKLLEDIDNENINNEIHQQAQLQQHQQIKPKTALPRIESNDHRIEEKNSTPSTILPMMCCCPHCCCSCGIKFSDGKSSKITKNKKHKNKDQQPARTRKCKIVNDEVELVPLLARRRALHRPISLSTTDVTKIPNPNSFKEVGHLAELQRQIKQKERRNQITRQIELESSQKHFETLDSLWGRPGHGAPRQIKNNKLNLNDLLYKIPFQAEMAL